MMVDKGVADRVRVRNFHAWCREQLITYHVPLPTTQGDEFAKQLVARLVTALERRQVPPAQYGAVLIDEGHDFEPDWLKLVVQMVDPDTNSLLVLYDDAQSIYGQRRSFSFKSVGVQAQGRTTVLRLNYRNSAEILQVAYEFAKQVLTPHDTDEDGVPLLRPQSAERHGPAPDLVGCPSLAAEASYLARTLAELHARGRPWSEMAIVYRWSFVEREVSKSLQAAGIPASVLKDAKGREPAAASNTVKLVTFHSSKGLEFPVVAIPGFGFLPDDREDEEQELRLAYVAMTRAMDHLIMTHHRESAFVQRVAASGARRLGG